MASFTAIRYAPRRAAWGALHMATQRRSMREAPGLHFWKLVGTGRGIGFSAVPDPLTWGLFAVWNGPGAWERFRDTSPVMRQYRARGSELYSLLLAPTAGHGRWSGVAPFGDIARRATNETSEPLVVLTRATIRISRLLSFWQQVPSVDAALRADPGLLLSFGFGETPWVRQGTLSVWRSTEAMQRFTARTGAHREAMRRTRAENWYAEELFTRFRLLRIEGTLRGADPLRGISTAETEATR